MKVIAISSLVDAKDRLEEARTQGYMTFVYHHADPNHTLLNDKFLYVGSDEELREKLHLLKMDVSTIDLIQR